MTNKEMENRIKNLEEAVSALAGKTYARNTVNEGDISVNTNEIASVKAFGEETAETTAVNEEALAYVIGEALPAQDVKNEMLDGTIDYILTEVIPSLMGSE